MLNSPIPNGKKSIAVVVAYVRAHYALQVLKSLRLNCAAAAEGRPCLGTLHPSAVCAKLLVVNNRCVLFEKEKTIDCISDINDCRAKEKEFES